MVNKTAGLLIKGSKGETQDIGYPNYDFLEFDDRKLQILTLNQLSKGIPAIGRMEKEVHNLNQSIGKTSPEEIGIKEVVTGLNNKYHTISLTLKAQLIVSVLILIAAVYALFFLLK